MNKYNEHVSLPFEIKETLLSNYNKIYKNNSIDLMPYEAFVIEIKKFTD